MISLGVLGEYIATIFYEAKRRPRFVIAERFDGNMPTLPEAPFSG
jgi:hypothetical protein